MTTGQDLTTGKASVPDINLADIASATNSASIKSVIEGFARENYDPSRDRETTRGKIAMNLVWTLIGLVMATFLMALVNVLVCSGTACNASASNMEAVKVIVQLLLTPIVALVGAVTGFYYGEKSGKGG